MLVFSFEAVSVTFATDGGAKRLVLVVQTQDSAIIIQQISSAVLAKPITVSTGKRFIRWTVLSSF